MQSSRAFCLAIGVILTTGAVDHPTDSGRAEHRVKSLKITVLSTMLAEPGIGEWGFSALVEADGHRILFDTGNRPETVLQNARDLKIDLSTVTDVVLSHHHGDHTGGLVTLRRELAGKTPAALSRIHVAPGIFSSRRRPGQQEEANPTIALKSEIEASHATFVEHRTAEEIFPGVWLTGPIPRPHAEGGRGGIVLRCEQRHRSAAAGAVRPLTAVLPSTSPAPAALRSRRAAARYRHGAIPPR